MNDHLKNTTRGEDEELSYYEHQGGYGIDTLVKGEEIFSADNLLETRSLEIHINIARKILKVGSLPNYESVVRVKNPNKIDSAINYRFFLLGLRSKTKITITRLEKVFEFNTLI